MATTNTQQGVPWDGRTAYERWVQDDLRLDLHQGYSAGSLGKVAVKPWIDRGIAAAFYDIIGAESLAGMYVGEIAPRQSSKPVRQLCDEVIFIISGRGSTTVDTPKGQISFEWGPRSLFAIPLNHRYQLHNGLAEPARFISVNTLPVVYNLFRDPQFVFGCEWNFDRIKANSNLSDSILYMPDERHERTAVNLHETTFVPDIFMVQRSSFAERGDGHSTVYFELGNSVISAHVAEHTGLRFFNPHRHGPSAFVFTLEGTGYSLMWQDGGKEVRFDWPEGDIGLIVPPNMWWHGHFVTSPGAKQLAIKLRSRKFPINHLFDKTHKFVSDGGTVLRYKDLEEGLRNRVWQTYVEECRRRGYEVSEPNRG
jgi:mannose-6-phosphate isomerase-like protein (cupin superfamily)